MIWWTLIGVWSGVGAVWWMMAFVLVARGRRARSAGRRADERRITVFKPAVAPRSPTELTRLSRCIESFVVELDADSEILVGAAEADRAGIWALLEPLVEKYPRAALKLVTHVGPEECANRKVALMKTLAQRATGDLWFWSDSDIEAPAGTLRSLRCDMAASGGRFITSAYAVAEVQRSAEVYDKLFVNLEFYPGAVLLGRLGQIRFGFGAGMLFEAARFKRRVDWDYLGSCLADDYELGRLLGEGRLGTTRLATTPGSPDWQGALLHYLRWHKTIRWCRPASYAAQLAVLPIIGWLLAVLHSPSATAPWLGLAANVMLDTAAACSICAALGAPLPWRQLPAVASWSVARGIVWLGCWLPWPIVWRDQRWWWHHAPVPPHAARLQPNRPHGR